MSSSNNNTKFSSEGFDLDAAAAGGSGTTRDDVVYEIGGGATSVTPEPAAATQEPPPTTCSSPIDESERFKAEGNSQFKLGAYLEAYDMYTKAIEACPGEPTGEELLKLRKEFDEVKQKKALERHRKRQQQQQQSSSSSSAAATAASCNSSNDNNEQQQQQQQQQVDKEEEEEEEEEIFRPPHHPYGDKLAIYYCNRSACCMHLDRYEEAIVGCDIALLCNPHYVKALVRRSAAYEKTDQSEEALKDIQVAMKLDPTNAPIQKSYKRLQKLEEERLEKLKEETIGKLKDLGNSLLGNFGLSLDNFNAVQDPNTGSYSISFNQNANK